MKAETPSEVYKALCDLLGSKPQLTINHRMSTNKLYIPPEHIEAVYGLLVTYGLTDVVRLKHYELNAFRIELKISNAKDLKAFLYG